MVENTNPMTDQPGQTGASEVGFFGRYERNDVISSAPKSGRGMEDDGAPAAEEAYGQAKANCGRTRNGDSHGALEPTMLSGYF